MRPGLAVLTALALAACGASTGAYARYDADADTCLSRGELRDVPFLASFDSDADDAVSWPEFESGWHRWGVFHRWDADADSRVTGEELGVAGAGLADHFVWDTDGSGRLDEGEVAAGIFAAWDTDGSGGLPADELYDGIFRIWDVDRDGCWGPVEYGEAVGADFVG